MDPIFLQQVVDFPMRPTKGLLSSKPFYQSRYPLSTMSSKINGLERQDGFAVWIKNYVSLGPKLIELMKHKLSRGVKIIQFGSQEKLFMKSFMTKEKEKLLQATQCSLYTTAGAIAGLMFVSTEKVAFCSNKAIKAYSTTSKLLEFQYKVSIPLEKIKEVRKVVKMKRASNCKYMEIVTVDEFDFWFTGFINHKKTLKCIHHATSHVSLTNS